MTAYDQLDKTRKARGTGPWPIPRLEGVTKATGNCSQQSRTVAGMRTRYLLNARETCYGSISILIYPLLSPVTG
jgi:hypothetical protein